MTYEPTDKTNPHTSIDETTSTSGRSSQKNFKDMSPDEVKENVRERVAKGVAAVAGALKGFTDESRKNHLQEETREAIRTAGETTREAASTTKDELHKTSGSARELASSAKDDMHKLGEAARDVGSSARQEFSRTSQEARGLASSAKEDVHQFGEAARDIGSSAKEEIDRTRGTMKGQSGGSGSSDLGSMPNAGSMSDYREGRTSTGLGSSTSPATTGTSTDLGSNPPRKTRTSLGHEPIGSEDEEDRI